MARNGSGTFSPSATGYPAVAGTTIESAKYNAVLADIATAITGSVACNGEAVITGNIPMATYKITGLGDATAAKDAMNRDASDARYAALAGATFTGSVTLSNATSAFSVYYQTGAAANEKYWAMIASGGNFYLQALDDASSNAVNPMTIVRTGTTIDSITFAGTTVAVTGNQTVSGTLTVGSIAITPSEGTFTAALRASPGGADIVTGTAKWKKVGNLVTLRIPALTASTAATALYIEALPAAIQATVTQSFTVPGYDATARVHLILIVNAGDDTIQITPQNGSTFDSGTNTKGVVAITVTYFTD